MKLFTLPLFRAVNSTKCAMHLAPWLLQSDSMISLVI